MQSTMSDHHKVMLSTHFHVKPSCWPQIHSAIVLWRYPFGALPFQEYPLLSYL